MSARLEYIRHRAESAGLVAEYGPRVTSGEVDLGRALRITPDAHSLEVSATCWADGSVHLMLNSVPMERVVAAVVSWATQVRLVVEGAPAGVPIEWGKGVEL